MPIVHVVTTNQLGQDIIDIKPRLGMYLLQRLNQDIFNTSEYLFIPRVVEELTPFVRAPYTDAHRE
jgi:hypothetical protein